MIRKTVLANTCVVVYCCGVAIIVKKRNSMVHIPTRAGGSGQASQAIA